MDIGKNKTAIILIACAGTFIIVTLILMACIMRKKMKASRYTANNNNDATNSSSSHPEDGFDLDYLYNDNDNTPICESMPHVVSSNNNFMCDGDQRTTAHVPLVTANVSSDSDEAEDNHNVVTVHKTLPFSRMKKSHSVGCYATSCGKDEPPYMRCPEEAPEDGHIYNDAILNESSLCNSYTKLKVVYDNLQSDPLRRTNSSPPIRTNRYLNNTQEPPTKPEDSTSQPDSVFSEPFEHEVNMIEGYNRAKFLYDRIRGTIATLSMSDLTVEEPTSAV